MNKKELKRLRKEAIQLAKSKRNEEYHSQKVNPFAKADESVGIRPSDRYYNSYGNARSIHSGYRPKFSTAKAIDPSELPPSITVGNAYQSRWRKDLSGNWGTDSQPSIEAGDVTSDSVDFYISPNYETAHTVEFHDENPVLVSEGINNTYERYLKEKEKEKEEARRLQKEVADIDKFLSELKEEDQ